MLNAGNELVAEEGGAGRWPESLTSAAPTSARWSPSSGAEQLEPARRLAAALRDTAAEICSGRAEGVAVQEARTRLRLGEATARRYVERLRRDDEGLVTHAGVPVDGAEDARGPAPALAADRGRRCRPVGACAGAVGGSGRLGVRGLMRRRPRQLDPAASDDCLRQHAGPVRDASDAGRDRARPRRTSRAGGAGGRRLLPRLRAQPTAVGHGLRLARPGAHHAAHPAGRGRSPRPRPRSCGTRSTLGITRGLAGFFFGAAFPSSLIYVGDTVPAARRQREITRLMVGVALGTALASLGAGVVADVLSWRVAFVATGFAALLLAVLLRGLPRPVMSRRHANVWAPSPPSLGRP